MEQSQHTPRHCAPDLAILVYPSTSGGYRRSFGSRMFLLHSRAFMNRVHPDWS